MGPGRRGFDSHRVPAAWGTRRRQEAGRAREFDVKTKLRAGHGVLPALLTAVAAASFGTPRPAAAHRDDYIDETFVYRTLERHELELEPAADLRGGDGQDLSALYSAGVEVGITSHWMSDGVVQLVHDADGVRFARTRFETRLRFAEEGEWPLDLAVSLEYELEREDVHSTDGFTHILTPRLVLSKDLIPDFNTTLNLDLPVEVSPDVRPTFAYAVGLRYPAETPVRVGVELKHDVTDSSATVFPQLWLIPTEDFTIKLGLGIGLGDAPDRFTGRVMLELGL